MDDKEKQGETMSSEFDLLEGKFRLVLSVEKRIVIRRVADDTGVLCPYSQKQYEMCMHVARTIDAYKESTRKDIENKLGLITDDEWQEIRRRIDIISVSDGELMRITRKE